MTQGGELPFIARVEDLIIPLAGRSLNLRLYYPNAPSRGSDRTEFLPGYLYLHGGGWHAGSLSSHEQVCRRLALASVCVIASLEYRLAPEFPAPAAVDDTVEAFRWLSTHARKLLIDPERIGIAGDSAGGTLTAVACLILATDADLSPVHKPRAQALLYPSVDLTCSTGPSYQHFGEGFYLRLPAIQHYVSLYAGGDSKVELTDWRLSPYFAPADLLSSLPHTYIMTAGCDPLLSDGEAYAAKLRAAGVPTTYTCYTGMIHAFLHLVVPVPEVAATTHEIGEAMGSLIREEGRPL